MPSSSAALPGGEGLVTLAQRVVEKPESAPPVQTACATCGRARRAGWGGTASAAAEAHHPVRSSSPVGIGWRPLSPAGVVRASWRAAAGGVRAHRAIHAWSRHIISRPPAKSRCCRSWHGGGKQTHARFMLDRGFLGRPFLHAALAEATRLVVRWPKRYHRVRLGQPTKTATRLWRLTAGQRPPGPLAAGMPTDAAGCTPVSLPYPCGCLAVRLLSTSLPGGLTPQAHATPCWTSGTSSTLDERRALAAFDDRARPHRRGCAAYRVQAYAADGRWRPPSASARAR